MQSISLDYNATITALPQTRTLAQASWIWWAYICLRGKNGKEGGEKKKMERGTPWAAGGAGAAALGPAPPLPSSCPQVAIDAKNMPCFCPRALGSAKILAPPMGTPL